MKDPATPDEWRDAVNLAAFMLLLDSARQYGLIAGGPAAAVDRCEEILRRGRALGYKPLSARELCRQYLERG